MKKLVVAGLSGTIYDAVLSKKENQMTSNRVDRTDECINAVAEHMKAMGEFNKNTPGFWQYEWDGVGTLTWQEQKDGDANADE